MSLLRVQDLTVRLAGVEVLRGVSLAVAAGELVGLIGPNGAGKTTLMRAALGLLPQADGVVTLSGEPVARMPADERARRVAWLPQEREIAWPLAVERLVALGRLPFHSGFGGLSAADHAVVQRAMQRMQVASLAARPATALSGGERARVLIARALAQEAPLLLADEPAAGLDPGHQIDLMHTFRELAAEGQAVLTSLHDLGLAARWCDRVVLLHGGQIVADGPPGSVLTQERLRAVYGIEAMVRNDAAEGLTVLPLGRSPDRPPI
jgi:iron complex transport system ATP-binding protein